MAASEEELVANAPSRKSNFKVINYSSIKAIPIEWYEKYWLPVTGLTGLAGPAGAGKSTLFAYEIAKLTTGAYGRPPIKVIYLAKEDPNMNKARLVAAGVDTDNVSFIKIDVPDDDVTYERDFVGIKDDLSELSDFLQGHPDYRALYLDPANSFLGVDEDGGKPTALRAKLEVLVQFADKHDILVRMMKHTKKDQGNSAKVNITSLVFGSTVWTEVPRMFQILWPVDEDLRSKLELNDDDETNILLFPGKNNYAPPNLDSKAFKIETVEFDLDGHHFDEVSKVTYVGDSNVTGTEVVEKKNETNKDTEFRAKNEDKAIAWIKEQLATGPVNQKTIQERAQQPVSGVSWMTVRRRKDSMVKAGLLKITNVPGATNNDKQWELTTLKLVVDNNGVIADDESNDERFRM